MEDKVSIIMCQKTEFISIGTGPLGMKAKDYQVMFSKETVKTVLSPMLVVWGGTEVTPVYI